MQNYTQCKGKKVLYIPSVFLSNERTPRVPLAGVATIAFPTNMETENIKTLLYCKQTLDQNNFFATVSCKCTDKMRNVVSVKPKPYQLFQLPQPF